MTLDERRRSLYLFGIPACSKYSVGSSGGYGSYGTCDGLNFSEWARRRKNGPTEDDFVGKEYKPQSPRVEMNQCVQVNSQHLKYFYRVCNVDGVTYSSLMTNTKIYQEKLVQNKYFFLQLLAKKSKIQHGNRSGSPLKPAYMVCCRNGDVGCAGSMFQEYFDDVASAVKMFDTIFKNFTNCPWPPGRDIDNDKAGNYYFVKLAPTTLNHHNNLKVDLALMFNSLRVEDEPKLSEFLNFIRVSKDESNNDDVSKVWMYEQLDASQIKEARKVLQKIQKGLLKKVPMTEQQLYRDSAAFYAKIPHCQGDVANRPVLIADECALYRKLKLLDDLEGYHPNQFHSRLRYVAECESDYKMIEEAVRESHGDTHTSFRLKVNSILAFDDETDVTSAEKSMSGELLWHGSHVTNTAGILKRGFQLPLWGEQMFGPAVYFSSCVSKAAKYCSVTPSQQPPRRGVLFLCELNLGKSKMMTESKNFKGKTPPGYDSIKGVGRYSITNPKQTSSGAVIYVGPPCDNDDSAWINYDEFAVTELSKIKIRFVVTVDFQFS